MENKFINGDCMHPEYGLPSYPDKFFDLAVVDPPYGIGEDGSKNHTRKGLAEGKKYKPFAGNDKEPPPVEYFQELIRVSKRQIIWGANHFIERIPNANSSCWIVWDKQNGGNDFADAELAWTSFSSVVRIACFKWNGFWQGDMKNKETRIHPTQKPVALYQWILEKYATEGNLILDTHVGSASSLIACESMGFNYVGFELDSDYYEAAKKRLKTVQARLF